MNINVLSNNSVLLIVLIITIILISRCIQLKYFTDHEFDSNGCKNTVLIALCVIIIALLLRDPTKLTE